MGRPIALIAKKPFIIVDSIKAVVMECIVEAVGAVDIDVWVDGAATKLVGAAAKHVGAAAGTVYTATESYSATARTSSATASFIETTSTTASLCQSAAVQTKNTSIAAAHGLSSPFASSTAPTLCQSAAAQVEKKQKASAHLLHDQNEAIPTIICLPVESQERRTMTAQSQRRRKKAASSLEESEAFVHSKDGIWESAKEVYNKGMKNMGNVLLDEEIINMSSRVQRLSCLNYYGPFTMYFIESF
ncbi:hypothetical protein ACH5RR_015327 [Cinchona calisaya]|uniref:Uncharacterized protein n=1 Tax=Cinchona calisaya TaxID=153742 RepID=A0ABD2ZT80_9GENT